MKYILIIKKTEKDENYATKVAEFETKMRGRYMDSGRNPEYPLEEITTDALVMECNEEQLTEIKKAALTAFK